MSESVSETPGEEEPVGAAAAAAHTDVSPERKEEVLAVLSAVIDPGEKLSSYTYACLGVSTAVPGPNLISCSRIMERGVFGFLP